MHFHITAPRIIERTMNKIDPRLMNHGKRVAYLMYRILKQDGCGGEPLRDLLLLGLLHDIGAYKTEELDRMGVFETTDVWGHSIYGYLFMKHFSPLKALAPALLYHHANVAQSESLPDALRMPARLIHLCDRADLFFLTRGGVAEFGAYLQTRRGDLFDGALVDRFLAAGFARDIWAQLEADEEFARLLYDTPMGVEAALAFMEMGVYSIDFRSPQTLFHTFAISLVARKLAELAGLDEAAAARVAAGALVHDIGKMGTPLHILEGTGKLSDADFAIMRHHVVLSEEILAGNIDADIVAMAVNHHERLDGSGYPKKLNADDLPYADRLMAVADVLSALWGSRSYKAAFPKEKVVSILTGMRGAYLDAGLVDLAVGNYDELAAAMAQHAAPVEKLYDEINQEWKAIEAAFGAGRFAYATLLDAEK